MNNRTRRLLKGMAARLSKAAKAPAGYSPIPGGKKGGYRKRSGKGWVYWYPDGKGGKGEKRPAGDTGDPDIDPPKHHHEHATKDVDKPGKTTPPPPAPLNTPEGKAQDKENLAEATKNPLARYKMSVLGKDKAAAKKVAAALLGGIEKSAKFCKMNPPACVGNLGIPRHDMPQLMDEPISKLKGSDEDWKAKAAIAAGADEKATKPIFTQMLDRFKEQGVKITRGEKVPVGQLKATQSEIQAAKAVFFADAHLKGKWPTGAPCDLANKPIVISSDNYILDGHHRYAALLTISPDRTMTTVRVDMPMEEILSQSMDMPGVFRADINDNVITGRAKPDFKAYASKAKAEEAKARGKASKGWSRGDVLERALARLVESTPGSHRRNELRKAINALEIPGADHIAIADLLHI